MDAVFHVIVVEQSAANVSLPLGESNIGVTGIIVNAALDASVLQVFCVSDTRIFAVVLDAFGTVQL